MVSRSGAGGNLNAQRDLGAMYATGRGVPLDEKEARTWYGRAADRGDIKAKQVLERMDAATAAHTYTLARPAALGGEPGARSEVSRGGQIPIASSVFRTAPSAGRSAIDPSVFRFSSPQFERRTASFGGPSFGGPAFGGFQSMGGMRGMGMGRGRR